MLDEDDELLLDADVAISLMEDRVDDDVAGNSVIGIVITVAKNICVMNLCITWITLGELMYVDVLRFDQRRSF